MSDTKKISSFQLGILTFFLAKASFFPIVSSMILKSSNHNFWISFILASFIGLIPLLIFIFINKHDENKNIFELNNDKFGKILGNILNLLIVLAVIIVGTIMLLSICNFIFSNYLDTVPQLLIAALFLLVISYAAIKGIETICRTSQILWILGTILFILGFVCLMYYIDLNNFKPIFEITFNNILSSTYNIVLFSTTPIFLLSVVPHDIVVKKERYKKSIIIGYIGALLVVFLTLFSTIGVLGNITTLFLFPEYIALKNIQYFHFFERIENIISIQWIFDSFVFLTLTLYFLKKYMSSIFKVKNEKTNNAIVILFSIILLILSNILFTNSLNVRNIIINNYSIIMLICFIIIPVIIYLKLRFKKIKDPKYMM